MLINVTLPGDFSNSQTLIGDIITRLLLYLIVIAGLWFFIRIIAAGFAFLTSMGDPAKVQAAQTQLLNALAGFIIVIVAYFLGQILQTVFGLNLGLY